MINISISTFKNCIVYLLMFLIGLNFKTGAIFLEYLLFISIIILFKIDLKITKNQLYILFFYLSTMLSVFYNYSNQFLYYSIKYFTYFILYYSIYCLNSEIYKRYKNVDMNLNVFYILIFSFVAGNMVHLILDMSITDLKAINLGYRVINDFWTGSTATVTIISGWGILIMPVLLYSFENRKRHPFIFIINIFLELMYIFFSFKLATRIGIFNSLFILLMYILLKIYNKEFLITKKRLLYGVGIIFIVFLISSKFYSLYLESNLYLRMSKDSMDFLDTNGRASAAVFLISNFFKSMFGGEYFTKMYGLQQHNIVFQIYDLYGIFSFLFFIIILGISFSNTIKIFKCKNLDKKQKYFLILLYISLILFFMEEPVMTSNFIVSGILFIYLAFTDSILYKTTIRERLNGGK